MLRLDTPDDQRKMTLMCYNDTFGYGWKHVDLFIHDADGNELNWVHWGVPEDGPEAADAVTARIEPTLKRVSDWDHHQSPVGQDYWRADVVWDEA
ncbi:hypothetical protein [Cryobacterium sp. PH29-G1]|jgi:hypothetical protein|uniref:hypothetical protein n=1 Tax=Cryobacterium sp. PH29-G1 TaxID=3046211 RepID=UPI0024BA7BE0|nr:hypothetical protein [Cryobacterium sp. PH29-G1]MDJ0347925.1 hypothetical protein [Cryobacterium sp. PH29-G1]